ncbi:unnamed protein product, partial [Mesorhabditis spiculigera]
MLWLLTFATRILLVTPFFDQKEFHLTRVTPSYALHGTALAWKQSIKIFGCDDCTFVIDYSKPGCNDTTGNGDNLTILCYDDFPFLLAGKVPDISDCTQAWSTCQDFQQFHFQCTWTVPGPGTELSYRSEVTIPGDYFALSIRVQEWAVDDEDLCIDDSNVIILQPLTSLTCVSIFDPEHYNKTVPFNLFRMGSLAVAGALLDIYAGGIPGNGNANFLGSALTSQEDQQYNSFDSVVTFMNRDFADNVFIVPSMNDVFITPNPTTPTLLSSFKYPWIFEEDREFFPETVIGIDYNEILGTLMSLNALDDGILEVGFTADNEKITSSKNYTSKNAGTSYPLRENIKQLKFTPSSNSIDGGLAVPRLSGQDPNFLLNIADIRFYGTHYEFNKFTAMVDRLDADTSITYTVCSLHSNSTMKDKAVDYEDCMTRADLMTQVLDCCSKTGAASNGQQIDFDLRNLTEYSVEQISLWHSARYRNGTAVDLKFELVAMQNVELTLFAIYVNGTTVQHNYTSSTGISSSELYLTDIMNITGVFRLFTNHGPDLVSSTNDIGKPSGKSAQT